MGNAKLKIQKIEKRDASTRLFCGMSRDGYIKIKKEGRLKFYVGEVFVYTQEATKDGPRSVRKLYRATTGFTRKTPISECFECFGSKSGRKYWANVVPVTKRASTLDADNATSTHQNAPLQRTEGKAKATALPHIDAIAAQRQAGLDPDVRMSFIVTYVGESRANIYRKMGKEFPMPTKRGRGSFWPLSVIDAYKAKTSREGGRNGQ